MLTSDQYARLLSLALKSAKCGLWDWDIKTDVVYFDANYYLIAGYEPDEFPHHFDEWHKRVHPEDVTLAEQTIQQYCSGEVDSFSVEFRFMTKNDGWVWILGQGEVIERDADGNPVRFIGLHKDITALKLSEQKLRHEMAFSKSLIETAQALVLVLDVEGRILQFNPYMEELTGYTLAEVLGKDWFSTFLLPENMRTFVQCF